MAPSTGYLKVKAVLDKAHSGYSQATNLQQEALQTSLGYLNTLDDSIHWFCDEETRLVSVEALALFSFPPGDALTWLQGCIEKSLSRCYNCAEKYQVNAKRELQATYTNSYAYSGEAVRTFLSNLNSWDVSRLSSILQNTLLQVRTQGTKLSAMDGPGFDPSNLCALFEVLWRPELCNAKDFYQVFLEVFTGIQEGGKLLRVAGQVLPAMYKFSFSEEKRLRDWSRKCFEKTKVQVSASHFKSAGIDAVIAVVHELQHDQIPSHIFWLGLQNVLRSTDPLAVFTELQNMDIKLMDMISGEVQSLTKSLQAVVSCIGGLLPAVGSNIWTSSSIPPQDFGQKIVNNPKFKDLLLHPESLDSFSPRINAVSELLSWMTACSLTQFGGNRYRVAFQFLEFLTRQDDAFCSPAMVKLACKTQALKILVELLKSSLKVKDKVQERSGHIELRGLIDSYASFIAEIAFDNSYQSPEWRDARVLAVDVMMFAVQLDCSILWTDFVSLSTTDYWGLKDHKYTVPNPTSLWSLISSNAKEGNIELVQRFLEITGTEMPLIDTVEIQSKMSVDLKVCVELFNRTLNSASKISNLIIQDIAGNWSANQILALLQRPQTNEGIIASVFSPNYETSQAILSLLKEAYQASGRIEAMRESFTCNFASTTQGFINVSNLWSTEGIFKSAVRVVRTGNNILDVLFSSRNGLISTGIVVAQQPALFTKLWQALWRVLETAYRMALSWAEKFAKEDLIEFMRDVLECSDLLLGHFSAFERAITQQPVEKKVDVSTAAQAELDATLLNECVHSITALTNWLRLNDPELLQSCVNLVCEILRRLSHAKIKISEETVMLFNRLIVNSKKHKNNLNEAHRTEIYIALSEHTDKLESPTFERTTISPSPVINKPLSSKASASTIYDQVALAAARKATATPPLERQKLPVSIVRPVPSLNVRKTMSAQERAEFLKNRSVLPAILQSKKPTAKNASAGAIKKMDSSDSDTDSGTDIEGLFATSDPKSPPKRKVEKRQMQRLDNFGPKIVRDARSERNRVEQNLRARINPDLTGLHMRMLSWHPLHEGALPPDSDSSEYSKLVNTYQSVDRYRRAVEPLFLLESWQHVVADRTNLKNKDKFEVIIQTRSAVDNFVDLVITMSMTDLKNLGISDPDLLILSTTGNFTPAAKDSSDACLAKVQHVYRKKDIAEVGLRTVPNAGMVKQFRPSVQLFAVKIGGLTPIHREYATLQALPYYDLCDEIVMGRPTKGLAAHSEEVNSLMKSYAVNEPQAKAIDAALNNTGFTLIQGPPGTGKTKTILGMVGAFLSLSRVQGNAIHIPGQRQQVRKEEAMKKKILLCAPSNAAVDEIVLRLKNGILDGSGNKYIPKIVRMGMSDAINANVRDVTLDALLDDMLNRADDKAKGSTSNDPTEIREKLNSVLKSRDVQRTLLDRARVADEDTKAIESEIKRLNNLKTQLGEQLDDLRDKQSQKARAKDIERKRFQTQILAEADIICATLSGSGHDLMASISVNFETVIIDEACQTTELNALIPLKYGCTRCIMVGDPNQLPPTVLSTEAVSYAYNESLFVRMQRNSPSAVRLLAIQYRMHSSISRFPSKEFYDGDLLDGPEVDKYTARPWHRSTIFGTYRFFDIKGREEESNSHSVYNLAEAKAALLIVKRLQEDFFDVDFDGRIGIITPYKEQHTRIRRLFVQEFGQNVLSIIDFNTVDGFQGQEKDIIIFSCVRANEKKGIGFLSDVRRMNVGLTRAKSSIFILGSSGALMSNKTWKSLVVDAQERKLFTKVEADTFLRKSRIELHTPDKVKIEASTKRDRSKSPTRPASGNKKPKFEGGEAANGTSKTQHPGHRHSLFDDFNKAGVHVKQAAKVKAEPQEASPLVKALEQPGKNWQQKINVKVEGVIEAPLIKIKPEDDVASHKLEPKLEDGEIEDSNEVKQEPMSKVRLEDTKASIAPTKPSNSEHRPLVVKKKQETSLFIKRKKPGR